MGGITRPHDWTVVLIMALKGKKAKAKELFFSIGPIRPLS
jgi:hypothetical protein